MAQHAQHSAIARYIEPAHISRQEVVAFQFLSAPAALTLPAVTSQNVTPATFASAA